MKVQNSSLRRLFLAYVAVTLGACGTQSQSSSLQTAQNTAKSDEEYRLQDIVALIEKNRSIQDSHSRLLAVTQDLVEKKVIYGEGLGEGVNGDVFRGPLARLDQLNCVTFIEIALSVARAKDYSEFLTQMRNIRYKDGVVSFLTRNHFADIDWTQNNISNGLLRKLTNSISHNGGVTLENSVAQIDKAKWFSSLHQIADLQIPVVESKVEYIPFREFFSDQGEDLDRLIAKYTEFENQKTNAIRATSDLAEKQKIRESWHKELLEHKELNQVEVEKKLKRVMLDQLPKIAILNLVTPGGVIPDANGTVVSGNNIGHQAILVQQSDGKFYVRESSLTFKRTIETSFAQYLLMKLTSKTQKGLEILGVQ